MKALNRAIAALGSALLKWALPRQAIDAGFGRGLAEAKRIVNREVDSIMETTIGFDDYTLSEVEIQTARLARRYDPGLALNEAAQRAMKMKDEARAAGQPLPMDDGQKALTPKQLLALEWQKRDLARILSRH